MSNGLDSALIERFRAIVGDKNALIAPADQAPYLTEWRDKFSGKAALVLLPGSTDEVAAIMRLAHATRTPIVPQGGNTGLVGGQIPFETGDEIVLALARLDRVRAVDPVGNTMVLEAGVTLERAQQVALEADRLFPLSLASEGTCQIGGNLASNAGGVNVLAYGNMRELTLGLEVVLADGRVWHGLRALRKDNTGYDLKHLFIGSEGTLGIITAAVLKLFPRPRELATAYAGLADLDRVAELFTLARGIAGQSLTAFEIQPRLGLDFVLRHAAGARDPLPAAHNWYALVEISGLKADGMAEAQMAQLLEAALAQGIIEDAAMPTSLEQRAELWTLRERMSEAQKPEGGSIKHDVSVPVHAIPAFIREADAAVGRLIPGARPVPFGHFGDGNIHYNISQPVGMDKQAFLDRWEAVSAVVHDIVLAHRGSISAEHGIGRLKRDMLKAAKSPVELDLMRTLKEALDPQYTLNPGKLL
jgi:FAD/FMN-containing dehydrogenase